MNITLKLHTATVFGVHYPITAVQILRCRSPTLWGSDGLKINSWLCCNFPGKHQTVFHQNSCQVASLRWLRRNAQHIVQSCKNGEGLPIQVYGDRDLFMQKLKSKPACLHRHGAREKSGILNINTSIFLTPPLEQV